MAEGIYTKVTAIAGVLTLLVGYLSLAYTIKWYPFHAHVTSSTATNVSNSNSRRSPSPKLPPPPPPQQQQQQHAGSWIAQLASIPVSAGKSELQRAVSEIQRDIPGAQFLNSSDYASLNPGFWVVYYRGPFNNGNQALAFCAAHGRTSRDQCIGRFLSHDAADYKYTCFPPAGSQVQGCYLSSNARKS